MRQMALWTLKVRNYYAPFGAMDPKELMVLEAKLSILLLTIAMR